MDITEVILFDHAEQRRLFAMLDEIDRSDIGTMRAVWTRLSAFLETHARAEEELFYPELLKLGERRNDDSEKHETEDAIHDHNEIRDGIRQASGHPVGSAGWWDGVTATRLANDEHMAEEEREGLTDFRRHVDLADRHRIALAFVRFEFEHVAGVPLKNQDPDEYVKSNS